jgi:hypothetical protein
MISRTLIAGLAGILLSGAVVSAQDVYQPLPSMDNPVAGHGGNNYGRWRSLDDMELTAITRATEQVENQMAAVSEGRDTVLAASLASPANQADVAARVRALAAAELTLALSRADAFARLKTEMRITDPDKASALAAALTSTNTGRGGGGGGGGGRGGAAAAAGRGGAARGGN